jgi:hypothetical protein
MTNGYVEYKLRGGSAMKQICGCSLMDDAFIHFLTARHSIEGVECPKLGPNLVHMACVGYNITKHYRKDYLYPK